MTPIDLRVTLEGALALSKEPGFRMNLPVEGVGNLQITTDRVVLIDRRGQMREITDKALDQNITDLIA